MKNLLSSKKGEGYFDICVGIIALLSAFVLTLHIYSFFTLKQDLDEISEQLIESAVSSGCFGDEFNERVSDLKSQMFDFDVDISADSYYNVSYKRVQLGDTMRVTVTVHRSIYGIGVFNIPVTCSSTRSGISEHYWKG